MRINQYLARCGVGSRRNVEKLILSGAIKVNNSVVTDLSREINIDTDKVFYKNELLKLPEKKYFVLNKPVGYTVTKRDPYAKKTIFELLPDIPGLIAVGRLDKNSTGLLITTNDGDFAQNIIHPTKKIEKEYLVMTAQELKQHEITKLQGGIMLDDGISKPKSVIKKDKHTIILTLLTGRNRQIRRMINAIGHSVTKLERVRIGKIKLDIPTGKYRELKQREIDYL